LVELPDPTFNAVLPEPILEMFTKGMNSPKDQTEQRLHNLITPNLF
jgi:hypothetical protein